MTFHNVPLEHFLMAYETRSLGKAAALLGLSQPALSKSIRKLESELGLVLFERHTTGLIPTSYADLLARRGRAIRADIRNSIDELHKLKEGQAGEARIGIAPALGPDFMARVVVHGAARYPSLTLKVTEGLYGNLASGVLSGDLDFALINLPPGALSPELEWRELLQDRFLVYCGAGHPLAGRKLVSPHELLEHPWSTPPGEGIVWQRLVECFAKAGLPAPRAALETNSAALIRALLFENKFLTFVPRQLMLADVRQGAIVELPVTGFVMERAVAIITRAGREHPVAAQLALEMCKVIAAQGEHDCP